MPLPFASRPSPPVPVKSLARLLTLVGSATLLSRITGFFRDVLIAALLGAGPAADAFVAAFLLPNLIRRMMSEGALNAALVPPLARAERAGETAERALIAEVWALLIAALVVILLGAELFMPIIMDGLARGFRSDTDKFSEAVLLARIAFPFVALVVLSAFLATLLNARERYAIAALAPLALNILMILALGALFALGHQRAQTNGRILVGVIVVGGAVQLALLAVAALRAGFSLRPSFAVFRGQHNQARGLLLLALPGMVVAGSGHLHLMLASLFASFEPKAMAWLYYADRLFQLPLGFVASAVGVVLLPRLSRALQAHDTRQMHATQSEALVFALALILPASLALLLLAPVITDVLFVRGAFEAQDAAATATLLRVLATSLPAFVVVKAFLPLYLAREEMGIPLFALGLGVAANVLCGSLIGNPGWGPGAGATEFYVAQAPLAPVLGVTIGAWLNAFVLVVLARHRMAVSLGTVFRLGGVVAATLGMGLVLAWCYEVLMLWMRPPQPFGVKGSVLAALCGGGVALYALLAAMLGVFRSPFSHKSALPPPTGPV